MLTTFELEKSPTGRRLIAEADAKLEESRQEVQNQIKRAEAEFERAFSRVHRRREQGEACVDELRPKWEAAAKELREARAEEAVLNGRSQAQIGRLRGELRRSAWPEVREAKNRIQELLHATRKTEPRQVFGERLFGGHYRLTETNRRSIEARASHLVGLTRENGPLDRAAMIPEREKCREAIAEIMNGIPEIGPPEPIR